MSNRKYKINSETFLSQCYQGEQLMNLHNQYLVRRLKEEGIPFVLLPGEIQVTATTALQHEVVQHILEELK